MDNKEDHTEDCGPNGCSSYCQSEKHLCSGVCAGKHDEHITHVEYTAEQKAVVDNLYQDILAAVEKTRKDGAIDVPMVIMPFAALLSNMFAMVEAQGGEKSDYLIIAFAKLLKLHADSAKTTMEKEMGHA